MKTATPLHPLVVLGDYAWDVLIRTNTKLQVGGDTFGEVVLAPGGSAANVAVWARRCGLETFFIGKIGKDKFGELAKDELSEERLEHYLIQTASHVTASVGVWIDASGERSMVSGKGADFYLLPSELPEHILKNCQHLHLSGWSFFTNPPRAAAQEAGRIAQANHATLSFDPASFQLIEEMGAQKFIKETTRLGVNILFPNFEEGKILSQEQEPEAIVKTLADIYQGALIALKLDRQGALIYNGQDAVHIPATKDMLIDATGAGDSFAGAFLSHYLKSQDPIEAARFATKVSGWVIRHLGARPRMDSRISSIIDY